MKRARTTPRPLNCLTLLLLLALCSSFCSRSAPQPDFYVKTLSGLNVRAEPNLKAKRLTLLRFNQPVTVLDRAPAVVEIDGLHGRWAKVRWEEDRVGWVFDAYLSAKPQQLYFRVSASSGLNLRADASLKSKVLEVLPLGRQGQILERLGATITLQGQRGFWFRASVDTRTGWLFSGFVLISEHPQFEDKLTRDEKWFLKYLKEPEELHVLRPDEALLRRLKAAKPKHTVSGYRIYSLKKESQIMGVDCGQSNELYFQRIGTSQYYSGVGAFSEAVLAVGSPLPAAVYTQTLFCGCCCDVPETGIYLLLPEKIIWLDYEHTTRDAACIFGSLSYVELAREYRYYPEQGRILMKLGLPSCSAPQPTDQTISTATVQHTLFVDLRTGNGGLQVRRTYDAPMPPDFSRAWDAAPARSPGSAGGPAMHPGGAQLDP